MASLANEQRARWVWPCALSCAVAACGGSGGPTQGDGTGVQHPAGALLVDDESSSNGQIALANGGYWYTYPPTSPGATITPTPETPFFFTPVTGPGFSRASCVSATGITGFGAGMGFGFQLLGSSGVDQAFDASAFTKVSFYAMSPDAPDVLVMFPDIGTFYFAPGATCAGGADAGPPPVDGYPTPPCGNSPQAAVPLSPNWQQVTLSFANVSSFVAPGYYSPKSVDSSGLFFMIFGLDNPSARVDGGPPLAFHLCVAQVYLLP